MRKIDKIIVHCSATIEGGNIKASTIRDWHVKGNKWKDIGYHYVVELDGKVVQGRLEKTMGAHTKGHNKNSIGICYVGGLDQDRNPKDTLRGVQLGSMEQLLMDLIVRYPEASVHGHNEFANKACPSFDVQEKFKHLLP
jgi:N-acetylmuramoyl-L-alanine amidase